MLDSNFFEPLGLTRTDASGQRDKFGNVAKAYMVLDDRTPVSIPKTPQSGQTLLGAAGGVKSCIDDLLVLYQLILEARITRFGRHQRTRPDNPFQSLADTLPAHIPFSGDSLYESSSGMG